MTLEDFQAKGTPFMRSGKRLGTVYANLLLKRVDGTKHFHRGDPSGILLGVDTWNGLVEAGFSHVVIYDTANDVLYGGVPWNLQCSWHKDEAAPVPGTILFPWEGWEMLDKEFHTLGPATKPAWMT